jgi:hypothetical protein
LPGRLRAGSSMMIDMPSGYFVSRYIVKRNITAASPSRRARAACAGRASRPREQAAPGARRNVRGCGGLSGEHCPA